MRYTDRAAALGLMKELQALDAQIGARIRARRLALQLNQAHLASPLGVSIQQVHKYEMGISPISASRLHLIAKLLQTSMDALARPPPPDGDPEDKPVTFA